MKEKILAYLKTKLAGVQETYLSGVADLYSKTITEESQIATSIPDGALELIKTSATHLQVEGDRRAAEAQIKALKTFREKHGLDENGKPIKKDPEKIIPSDPDEPLWFKAYREKTDRESAELRSKFEGIEKNKTQEQLMARLTKQLKDKGVDEVFIPALTRNLIIESEDKVDQLVAESETIYKDIVQKSAEKGVVISVPPISRGGMEEGVAAAKSVAEKRNTSATQGVQGKKI